MPEISVWPDDVEVHFDTEVNLLEALVSADIPIAHLCGGKARCSTCRIRVREGIEHMSLRTEPEQQMAERLDFSDEMRLACQTKTTGSVDVARLVLDSTDVELASQLGKPKLVGPVGREVDVAVLFTDVVDYTSMADTLPAYDVVHLLNRFFARTTALVEENGGRVDNYIGDAVFAVFGVEGNPDPALGAVRTGLGILAIANDLTHYLERIYRMGFGVRVGIHFGEVVFGLMGAESAARETVIGDAVNVASRLEAANKETGTSILVSDPVRELTQQSIEYGRRFELDLRGKTGLVTAHEVIGEVSGVS